MTIVDSSADGEDRPTAGQPPLNKARILITRAPERALPLAAAFAAAGAQVLLLPLIDFERATDQQPLEAACDTLAAGGFDWLVITSATTVHVLAEKAAGRGLTLQQLVPARTRIAAVGPACRRLLESAGLPVALTPRNEQSAAGLLEVWPDGGGKVLLPQTDIAPPRLADGLAAAGSTVTAVTAYRTVDYPAAAERRLPVPDTAGKQGPPSYALLTPDAAAADLAAGRIHAVVATSPSAVRRIQAISPRLDCHLVVIGRSTAEEATALGLAVAAVAAGPTPRGLVAAVETALGTNRNANKDADGQPP